MWAVNVRGISNLAVKEQLPAIVLHRPPTKIVLVGQWEWRGIGSVITGFLRASHQPLRRETRTLMDMP